MTEGADILIYQILNCIAINLVREGFRIQATAIAFRTGDLTQKRFGFISLFARFTLLVLFPDDGMEAVEGLFIFDVAFFEVISYIEFYFTNSLILTINFITRLLNTVNTDKTLNTKLFAH